MNEPEIKLIIACARTKLTPENRVEIKKHAGRIKDWQRVIWIASFHRVIALLYSNLKTTCPDLVPQGILEQLKKIYTNNAVKSFSYSIVLLKIIDLFEKNNIPAIPFKGPTIAEKAYEDLNLRSFGDLDILIKKKDVQRAEKLLLEHGYTAEISFSPPHTQKYLEHENSLSFYHKNSISIDLHWEITGRYLLHHLYFEDFEDRLQTTSLLNKKICSIPDDLMLVYLCIHGTSHCWDRFEWICCFVELIKKQNKQTILNALNLAEAMGAKRMFLLGLYLGQYFLDTQYPEQIQKAIVSDQRVVKCADEIKNQIFDQKTYPIGDAAWRFSPLHTLIRDSFFDRLKYLIYLFTMPTIKEWSKYQVPHWLTPLYRMIRPFRLAVTYFFGNTPGNTFFSSLYQRVKEMVTKKRALGSGALFLFVIYVPGKFIEKLLSTLIAAINKLYYNRYINAKRTNRFHKKFKSKMDKHFYIIGMPGMINFLEPCIELIHNKINLFLILNGVKKNEKKYIAGKYPDLPILELKTFCSSSIPHGDLINLLLHTNENNFGLIDHDLFIFDKKIFNQLDFNDDEFIAGPFELHNRKAGITFPATFFLFINTKIVKKIMTKYKIGAQIYDRIPSRLLPVLKKMNLGYDNFLKEYLNYFDPFNMIFAMAAYEGLKTKIIKIDKDSMLHLGGNRTKELLNESEKTKKLIESIMQKKSVI